MLPSAEESQRHIQRLSLFEGLDAREKAILAGVFRPRGFRKGDTLCREGDGASSFFIVAMGSIDIFKELPDGRRELLHTVGPNAVLGQVSLIVRGPRSATLTAATSSIVLECSVSDFDRLFSAGTPFAYKLMDTIVTDLSRRVRDADRELASLFSNPKQTLMRLHEAMLEVQKVAIVGRGRD